MEITGGTVSGKECAIFYSFHEADSSSGIIISGGTISCGEGDGRVFLDNLFGGSDPGCLILKGGSYPNGIVLSKNCCDLSDMLAENGVCLDSEGNVVALTAEEKNYSTIRSIVQDEELPIVQYQIGEQEAVTLSDENSVTEISATEGEKLALSASDRLKGMDTLSYHISQAEIEDITTILQDSWKEYTEPLSLEENNGCYLYVQAKDKAGNTVVHALKLKVCLIPKITDVPTIIGTYGQSLSEMTLSKVEGVSDNGIAGTWSITQAGKENIYPTVGTDATYEVTFTPTDNANYSTVTKSTTVTVSKATPYIVKKPIANEITRNETLSNSSLTGGKVQCSETNTKVVEGTFTWLDANVTPTVDDSNVREYEVVFTPSDTENYDTVITTVTITVNKIENVPNRPQNSMNVSNEYTKIAEVPLPNGWEWKVEDKVLEVGKTITATAQYTGGDKVDYINIEIAIEVTRSECEHTPGAVVWDGTVDTDVAPTCEREGYGHTTCTKCGNVVKSGIYVQGLKHKYKSEITKKATYTEEGIRTYTCTQPGCTDSHTEVIEKLKRPSYSGNSGSSNSGNSGSTTNPPTTEEPSTEEPSTQEPTTEEPSTQEPSTDESTKEEPTTKEPDSTEENPIDWKQDENGVFYEKEDGTKATGWYEMEDGDWYYFNEDGYRQTGWEKDGDTWYYLNETGVMQTGWQKDNDTWYYLSESGAMQTGWQKDGDNWYYLSESGSMQTGWKKDGESWYYLSGSGAMQTGWLKEGGSWYYLSGSGAMQIGWLKDGETWYYLNASGSMKTGWLQIGADWFYLNANGSMAADTYIGIWYVDKNGYYIPSKTK